MQSKLLHEANGKRTFAVILQKGDEAMRCLQDFAVKERLALGRHEEDVHGRLQSFARHVTFAASSAWPSNQRLRMIRFMVSVC